MTREMLSLISVRIQGGFAVISATVWTEIAAGVAIVITLIGMRLCWGAPRYRMSVEEHAKDGKLTEDQARRRIEFMRWFGPAVTIVGCGLLALAVSRIF